MNSSEREFNRNDSAANHKSLSRVKRFQSFREACYRYAEDPVLDFAVTMTIIFNTVLMMAQHHNAPKGFVKASNIFRIHLSGVIRLRDGNQTFWIRHRRIGAQRKMRWTDWSSSQVL